MTTHELSRREQRVRAAIKANGLQVEQIGTAGAVRIFGPGVYVMASNLRHLQPQDLEPLYATSSTAEPYELQ